MPPVAAALDDLGLRDKILGGDRAAAGAFFDRHVEALYEFVHYRVGGDRPLTEDVVQDTFLVALQRLATFDGRSTLHTWLCGIARKRLANLRRKRQPLPLADVLAAADAEIDDLLLDVQSQPLPEWILERAETKALVGAALSSLSPDYRELLLDKYVTERSVVEMASARGEGLKATESRLHRARLAFARVVQLLARRRGGLP